MLVMAMALGERFGVLPDKIMLRYTPRTMRKLLAVGAYLNKLGMEETPPTGVGVREYTDDDLQHVPTKEVPQVWKAELERIRREIP